MRRLDMLKAREILKLKYEAGLSLREIAQSCNCGKSTASDILKRAETAGISWPITLSDKQLMSALYPPVEKDKLVPEPDMEYVYYEMKKKGVTLMLLWEEYKEKHPDGIMYTQFCERYKKFKISNKLTMHIEHKGGEEMQVDWAGTTLSYTNRFTGDVVKVYIFVSVLPASSYPFVYAYEDMTQKSWIDAHIRTYEYYGGVPSVTIPDNTKTAVIKPDVYDPVLNKTYREMAAHYRTAIVPARARKPKDKAADENTVKNIGYRILAPLRNSQFFSLKEVNCALKEQLEKFIERPFQKMAGNRRIAFEKIDKPYLKPLPSIPYEYSEWKEVRVQFNYHVEYDGFYYSVHYSYVGQKAWLRVTSKTIEVFIDGQRIDVHNRNYNTMSRYITRPEHMAPEHKAVTGWNEERFCSWAKKTGPKTEEYIKQVLKSRDFPQQTFRTCMGIMRLGEDCEAVQMEAACEEAIKKRIYTYKYFSNILKQILQKGISNKSKNDIIIKHSNIRGSKVYEGGGIHAN